MNLLPKNLQVTKTICTPQALEECFGVEWVCEWSHYHKETPLVCSNVQVLWPSETRPQDTEPSGEESCEHRAPGWASGNEASWQTGDSLFILLALCDQYENAATAHAMSFPGKLRKSILPTDGARNYTARGRRHWHTRNIPMLASQCHRCGQVISQGEWGQHADADGPKSFHTSFLERQLLFGTFATLKHGDMLQTHHISSQANWFCFWEQLYS